MKRTGNWLILGVGMGKIQNESGAPYGAGKEGNANNSNMTEHIKC